MSYTTFEPDFTGIYTQEGMKRLYSEYVDKSEYTDFAEWKIDMIRSGIFKED